MARIRPFADGPELACHDLCLPFGIESDGQNRLALIAKKLEGGNGSHRHLLPRAKRHDDDVGCDSAFWAFALHRQRSSSAFTAYKRKWPSRKGTAIGMRQAGQQIAA